MTALQLTPVALSLLVLAAHFLRSGSLGFVLFVFVLLAFLFVRRPWAARAIQVGLVLGALEWIRTLFALASSRAEAGQPLIRLTIILGVVAVVTGLSALVFRSARLRSWYRLDRLTEPRSGAG